MPTRGAIAADWATSVFAVFREVAPHCVPRLIGFERFYDRLELDAWVDRLGGGLRSEEDWLEKVDHDLDQGARR